MASPRTAKVVVGLTALVVGAAGGVLLSGALDDELSMGGPEASVTAAPAGELGSDGNG